MGRSCATTAPGGADVWQVATVTCPPNGDVRDIHDRMGVLLAEKDLRTWIEGDQVDAAKLMRPVPDGALQVAEAKGVDWSGP